MSLRENVRQIVDVLPEDQLADLLQYLTDTRDTDETLSGDTAAAVQEGLNDIANGRTISLEDYRRTRGL